MKLLSLHAHNVFSIGTIDLDLKDRGLTLVSGWSYDDKNGNMAGKSSLANHCISWGLYGKTVHGIKADDVINTSIKNAKHCGVTIHFEGIDGKTYRIMRQRKPNVLMLAVGDPDEEEWVDLSKRNEKDTQELIDKLLGRDHKTFIQSDFFGQGRERSFLSLPGAEQRAVIEEILPLNSLEAWAATAKAQVSAAKDLVDQARISLHMATKEEEMLIGQGDSFKTQATNWDNDRSRQLSETQSKLNTINKISDKIDKEIAMLYESLPPNATAEETLAAENRNIANISSQISSLQYGIDELTKEIDRRQSNPTVCMSCSQSLPAESIAINESAIRDAKASREKKAKEKAQQEAFLYNANANIGICNEVIALEKQVASKEQAAMLQDRIANLRKTVNPYDNMRKTNHEARLKALDKKKAIGVELAKSQEKLEYLKFWHNAFSNDIKTLLFYQVCPFLEDRSNQYLRDLNNGQIKVSFSTTKELKSGDTRDQFCVTASSDTGSKMFELFSGAEKQLTSFAVGMALSDLAAMQVEGASSFMILDEPFLYQSPENCENIVNFITHKLGHKSTILLISNEDNLANLIPNRIHVVKRKGVTSIE